MPSDRPDPAEFIAQAQRMLRQLFGDMRDDDDEDPWARATRSAREAREARRPSAEEQRQNLTFALATRAVEALEDLALNVAAIRQRLERTDARTEASEASDVDGDDRPTEDPGAEGDDAPER